MSCTIVWHDTGHLQADKAKDAKGKTEAKEPVKEKEDPKAKLPGDPMGPCGLLPRWWIVDDSGEIELICSPIPDLLLVLTVKKVSTYSF